MDRNIQRERRRGKNEGEALPLCPFPFLHDSSFFGRIESLGNTSPLDFQVQHWNFTITYAHNTRLLGSLYTHNQSGFQLKFNSSIKSHSFRKRLLWHNTSRFKKKKEVHSSLIAAAPPIIVSVAREKKGNA